MIAGVKRNNCATALDIARTARGVRGGVSDEFPAMRHMVDLETVTACAGACDAPQPDPRPAQTGRQEFF